MGCGREAWSAVIGSGCEWSRAGMLSGLRAKGGVRLDSFQKDYRMRMHSSFVAESTASPPKSMKAINRQNGHVAQLRPFFAVPCTLQVDLKHPSACSITHRPCRDVDAAYARQ